MQYASLLAGEVEVGMSESTRILDQHTLVDRNLTLVGEHLAAVFTDATLLETIPQRGATVVFIPDDDPDLAQCNLDLALQFFAEGKNVYLYHVHGRQPVAQDTHCSITRSRRRRQARPSVALTRPGPTPTLTRALTRSWRNGQWRSYTSRS